MHRSIQAVVSLVVILMVALVAPQAALARGGPPPGGGGGETTAANNLSFPAIAVDGFAIAPGASPSFSVEYTGDYPGLTADEISLLQGSGPWYPQKTDGNAWQATFTSQPTVDVSYIDWGDNIESVNPRVRAPFRLEVTLYRRLDAPMAAYRMAVLEYPSSSAELQGTNNTTYDSGFATAVSDAPRLVIQYLGTSVPATLTWAGVRWITPTDIPTVVPVRFAPELNVAGKYVFGASEGGWKPDKPGYYRITYYVPAGGVNLAPSLIGNYADFSTGTPPSGEGAAATPLVAPELNLTYVDVLALGAGGGGRR